MAYIVPLADLSAPQLSPYVGLTHAQLRSRRDPAQGTLIAESPNVISSALDAGCQPLSLLMEQRQLHTLPPSLYYRVGVIRAPLQGLCYNVRDAVDWFSRPTARRFQKGSNHSPLQYC